jgi:hypothetical protein
MLTSPKSKRLRREVKEKSLAIPYWDSVEMKPKDSAAYKVTPFSPKSNQNSAFGDYGECRCNASGDGFRIRNKVRSNCATKFGGTDGNDRKHKKGGIDYDCRNLKRVAL